MTGRGTQAAGVLPEREYPGSGDQDPQQDQPQEEDVGQLERIETSAASTPDPAIVATPPLPVVNRAATAATAM